MQQVKQLGILLGFILEIVTRIVTRYFFALNSDEAKATLQNKGALSKKIKVALAPVFMMAVDEYAAQRTYWEGIYLTHYGMAADFGEVTVPEKPTVGKWRLIFILKGLTMNHAAAMYRKILAAIDPPWQLVQYIDDLDAQIPYNIRTSAESYALWVRDGQEADEEFRAQTTSQADPNQLIGVTPLERLVHGAAHFVETKQHLDEKGITICSGSRNADGCVPCVCSYPDSREVCVFWYNLGYSFSAGGVRRTVALPQAAQTA
ncbi:MAG: hypothetical protein Q7S04_02250 [Candidatus Moranbacteria bacterium]|nr:hypothetical protein [Candidatus Moranbacteria bacterium]